MCYNCGCGMLDNDLGDPKNITNRTFEEAAKAAGETVEEAKRNVLEELKKQLEKKK
ncbi:MAG TPA: hypothetical protein VEM15_07220 [Thermodesulfobacteriota bacterium]|nr:hypothetical protein [Thermodesulfobacteriota bacterium]